MLTAWTPAAFLLGLLLLGSVAAELVTTPEAFGAVGDGKADDWVPIQRALAACSAPTGASPPEPCRVVFANSYLSGPLLLNTSATTLDVRGTLAMLPRKRYLAHDAGRQAPFITNNDGDPTRCRTVAPLPSSPSLSYRVCLSDVRITGNGNGVITTTEPDDWWLCKVTGCFRPHLLVLQGIERVTIEGLTFRDAANHNIEVENNVGTRLRRLTVSAPYLSPNTDGVNFYGGFDSVLEDSVVDNGDDCVSVVPVGLDKPNFCAANPTAIACSGGHVIVRNVTCNGGHGMSIGGVRHGSVTNVTFTNVTATGGQIGSTQDEDAGGGCRIKSYPNSTGVVAQIRYIDMVLRDVYLPLQLLGHYCPFPCKTPDGNTSVLFANISFEHVRGSSSQRSTAAEFKCSAFQPCENITLVDVRLADKNGGKGKLTCENVGIVHIDNASTPSACA